MKVNVSGEYGLCYVIRYHHPFFMCFQGELNQNSAPQEKTCVINGSDKQKHGCALVFKRSTPARAEKVGVDLRKLRKQMLIAGSK